MFNLQLRVISRSTVNVLKLQTLLSFFSQTNVSYQGWNSQNACQNSTQRRPRSNCFFRSSLFWVCTVCECLGLFGRQLVLEILEHLLYIQVSFQRCPTYSCDRWPHFITRRWVGDICPKKYHWYTKQLWSDNI